jgi:hypothetical protein
MSKKEYLNNTKLERGLNGRDCMVVGYTYYIGPIITKVVCLIPAHVEVYWIQH